MVVILISTLCEIRASYRLATLPDSFASELSKCSIFSLSHTRNQPVPITRQPTPASLFLCFCNHHQSRLKMNTPGAWPRTATSIKTDPSSQPALAANLLPFCPDPYGNKTLVLTTYGQPISNGDLNLTNLVPHHKGT